MLNLRRAIFTIVIGCWLILPLAGLAQTSVPQPVSTSAESAKIVGSPGTELEFAL